MSPSTIAVTVILACRDIGRFLHPSVRSVAVAIETAESEMGVAIEWLIAADTSSQATADYLHSHVPARARQLLTCNGDFNAVKNQAVREAEGQAIAVVTGDDLVASNWLTKSLKAWTDRTKLVVLHPGAVVVFGNSCFLFSTPDQENPDFSKDTLFSRNHWPGISFGPKEIFACHQFIQSDTVHGFGHADWHWACETVEDGVCHKPVPGTISCCHQRGNHSCITPSENGHLLMPPGKLFQLFSQQDQA